MMRPTYLCIPDIPDGPPRYVDIEGEQEQAIIDKVGIWPTIWIWRKKMDIYRELGPKVRPAIEYHKVAGMLNIPDWLLPLCLIIGMIFAGAWLWGRG